MQTTTEINSTHQEHELATAAYLWSRGFRFLGVASDPSRPPHKIFLFSDDGSIKSAVTEYLNGGTVRARDFARSLVELKSFVYNADLLPDKLQINSTKVIHYENAKRKTGVIVPYS